MLDNMHMWFWQLKLQQQKNQKNHVFLNLFFIFSMFPPIFFNGNFSIDFKNKFVNIWHNLPQIYLNDKFEFFQQAVVSKSITNVMRNQYKYGNYKIAETKRQ